MITTKKIIGLGAITALALMSLSLSMPIKAEETASSSPAASSSPSGDEHDQTQVQATSSQAQERDGDHEDEDESDINNVNEHEHEEGDVNNEIKDQLDIEKEIKLASIRFTASSTYGEAISYLRSLQVEIAKIKTNSTVDTASSSLSAGELALLNKLVAEHNDNFQSLNADIDALNAQIQAMIDLLTPISGSTIAPQLRGLLFSEIKEFRRQVKNLANLEALDYQILNQETL